MTSLVDALAPGRGLLTLTSRLLSAEIDARLYRALLAADAGAPPDPGAPPMVSEELGLLPEDNALEELSAEFCRLFIGPRPACPPYESVFRGEAMLGGRAEARVNDFLARHGLQVVLPPGLPVLSYDHLGVQLTVLDHLCSTGSEDHDEAEPIAEFLRRHLRPWATDYLFELHAAARFGPYSTVAELTARLLRDL